jgi:hypothetical protein
MGIKKLSEELTVRVATRTATYALGRVALS